MPGELPVTDIITEFRAPEHVARGVEASTVYKALDRVDLATTIDNITLCRRYPKNLMLLLINTGTLRGLARRCPFSSDQATN